MESRNRLGIYIRKDRATVVCLAGQGRDKKLLDAFSVTAEEEGLQPLADAITQACAERDIRAAEAAVALDCALFMQHSVHSDFGDYRKIAATVRFDTEEALATDVSEMAVSFRIVSTDQSGANLDVYTAERSVLSDILMSLQANGIDPVAVNPDVWSLSRYLSENGASNELPEGGALYALLSDSRGYLVQASNPPQAGTMRAFMVGPAQDRKALLGREILVTAALGGSGEAGQRLCVLDAGGKLAAQDLAQNVPLEVLDCDLAGLQRVAADDLADCANVVDFAIAYGAALPEPEKDNATNFRNDHMPYLGQKRRLEKALRFEGICLAVLFLALGIYAQAHLMRVNRDRAAIRDKFEPDYLAVMPHKKELPDTMRGAVQSLQSAKRQIEKGRGAGGDKDTIPAKLTAVFQGLNACAARTDLNIDTITLTNQNILINGDTSSRANTLKVFDAMGDVGLTVVKPGFTEKGQRDAFDITVEPK